MARLWYSGFELNSQTTGVEFTAIKNGGTSATIVSTGQRSGSYAGQTTSVSGDSSGWLYSYVLTATSGPYYLKFAFKYTALPTVNTVIGTMTNAVTFATVQAADPAIKLTTAGKLQLWNNTQIGSDSPTLTSGTWYEVEMYWDNTPTAGAKILKARLNQVEFAASSTITALNTNIRSFVLGSNLFFEASATGTYQFDDIAINDGTGASQNTYVGSEKVIFLFPNAAGEYNNWAQSAGGTAGAANNYTRVNEIPPDDSTSYMGQNSSASSFPIESYNITDTPAAIGASDTINVVAVGARFGTSGTGASAGAAVRLVNAAGGTQLLGSTYTSSTITYRTNVSSGVWNPTLVTYADPDGSPWTKATLDTSQIGARCVSSNTIFIRLSTIWMMVAWTPAVATTNKSSGFFVLARR